MLKPIDILELLKQRCQQNWLSDYDSRAFYALTLDLYQQLSRIPNPSKIVLVAVAANPYNFLAAFLAGIAAGHRLFLGSEQWREQEWKQVFSLVQPDLVLGFSGLSLPASTSPPSDALPQPAIMIPTGGTSGTVRFAIHSWENLQASVHGLQAYFQSGSIDSFCVLPLYHVSGLMQFLRSFLTGGNLYLFSYGNLKVSPPNDGNWRSYFISLVPTQLQFILDTYPEWLGKFKTVFVGGAATDKAWLERARTLQINLSPTYGMTETASQIATLKPEEFLLGNNSIGRVLPHACIEVKDRQIVIRCQSLFLGYYPQIERQGREFVSDDLGYFDALGFLYILGRKSQVIISGGEKVFPREVESALLATGFFEDVVIIGWPDSHWGQVVVGIYVPKSEELSLGEIQAALEQKITKFKQPKHWIKIDRIPRNEGGKINYQRLMATIKLP